MRSPIRSLPAARTSACARRPWLAFASAGPSGRRRAPDAPRPPARPPRAPAPAAAPACRSASATAPSRRRVQREPRAQLEPMAHLEALDEDVQLARGPVEDQAPVAVQRVEARLGL